MRSILSSCLTCCLVTQTLAICQSFFPFFSCHQFFFVSLLSPYPFRLPPAPASLMTSFCQQGRCFVCVFVSFRRLGHWQFVFQFSRYCHCFCSKKRQREKTDRRLYIITSSAVLDSGTHLVGTHSLLTQCTWCHASSPGWLCWIHSFNHHQHHNHQQLKGQMILPTVQVEGWDWRVRALPMHCNNTGIFRICWRQRRRQQNPIAELIPSTLVATTA